MKGVGLSIPPLIGQSKYIEEVKNVISSISKNNASVLLCGESGTGKRLIALNIHKLRNCNTRDFYEINCKAFSSTDIEELFKVIINLYSGTNALTLFIANIDYLQIALQNYLISLLKMVKIKNINLKLICSTERNLDQLANNSGFLTDLYYLISTIIINTRPLRARKDDILLIAQYYFEKFNKQTGKNSKGFSNDAKNALLNYYWPGNIDELVNAIQRGFILSKDEYMTACDLGVKSQNESNLSILENANSQDLKTAIDLFKKEYVTKVLQENNWNQTKTSKILGIQRTYVIKLIKDLNIKK